METQSLLSGILKGTELQVGAVMDVLLTAGTRWQKCREAFIPPLL